MAIKNTAVISEFATTEELAELGKIFSGEIWSFGWQSNPHNDTNIYWHTHFAGGTIQCRADCEAELASNEKLAIIYKIWKRLKEKHLPEQALVRVYGNGHTFGVDGAIHRDNKPELNGVTAIVYAHGFWCLPWGGELMFYSQDGKEIIQTISPSPGKAVIFDGSIRHAAKSPSRECRNLRISLVFKTVPISELDRKNVINH